MDMSELYGNMTTKEAGTVQAALRILSDHNVQVQLVEPRNECRAAPAYDAQATIPKIRVTQWMNGRRSVEIRAVIEEGNVGTIRSLLPEGTNVGLGEWLFDDPIPCMVRVFPSTRGQGAIFNLITMRGVK